MDFSIGQPTTGRGNRGTISVRRSIEVTGEKTQFYSEVVSIPLLPFSLDDETFNERNDCGPIVPNSLATATPQSEDVDSPSSSGSQRLLSDVEDSSSTTSLAFGTDALDTLHGRRSPHQQPQWTWDHAQNQHQLASKLNCEGSDCFCTSINLQPALDLTAGTGIWGRDLTAAHPSSEMTETGIVPIHHEERFNCRFELDNIKSLWRRASGSFDLIQGRGLLGNIRDWGALCRNVFSTLRPGGHFELSHLSFRFSGKCGPLDPCHVWSRVSEQIRELGRLEDCSFDAKDGGMSTACIESASFQDIHESRQVVPVTACLDYVLQYIERALLRKWKWDYVPENRAKEHLKWLRRDLEKEAVGVYTECVKIWGHKPNLSQPIRDDHCSRFPLPTPNLGDSHSVGSHRMGNPIGRFEVFPT
ncbi:Secondary metabolism regulator laeA like protein [Verticillium longisporum]|nr:Secondary metabolism regulator laeA like protein [Verticillium longisporum]